MANRDFSRILQINGVINGDCKSGMKESISESFNELYGNMVTRFGVLSNSDMAIKVYVNEDREHTINVLFKESGKKEYVQAEKNKIKSGDMLYYKDEVGREYYYLIISPLNDFYDYSEAEVQLCNNFYNLEGMPKPLPCYVELEKSVRYNPYDQKNNFVQFSTGITTMLVQTNEFVKKVLPKTRFVFKSSKMDVYEVLDTNDLVYEGVRTFIINKANPMQEDDFVNNIGYDFAHDSINPKPQNHIILGENKMKSDDELVYGIHPQNIDVVFEVPNDGILSIVSQKDGLCTVKSSKVDVLKRSTLKAKMNGEVIAIIGITVHN